MDKNNDKIQNPENDWHLHYTELNRKQTVNIIWPSAVANSFHS